ncbi:peroxisomal biogenesis factor 11 [Aspergillus pseudoustus]|uniref:Peroxisomal biogenesis factor 11 n=1 Tax=Aspergillus pseudoustus TaxID=1810923 RepID=A0ABR4IYD0_9EURO
MALVTSPIKQLATFTSQTAGLEKTLRLIQATSQVVGELTPDKTVARQWLTARDQLALGRRYFRLLDFYGCFERVHGLLAGSSTQGGILTTIEMAEYTFLGLYLLLENLTILHDMNVYHVSWYKPLLTEANKFWFYAIILSITRATWALLFTSAPTVTPSKTEKGAKTPAATGPSKSALVKGIVINACDLTLPGSFVGWVPATGLQIGIAMVVSTLLAGHNIWVAQRQAR